MISSIISSLTESVNLTFTTFILVFTVCILVQRLLSPGSNTRYQNLPPCPSFKLPVIGHLHLLDADITKPFRRFREQLGNVFRLQFGNRTCIVICGFDAIKEALVKNGDTFTYRPVLPLLDRIVRGAGLGMANGEKWKEHRRFTLTTLKDFGMGKSVLEKKIHEEIQLCCQAVDAANGEPFSPKQLFQTSVANIICSMIFGSTFIHGDEKFKALIGNFEENMRYGVAAGISNFIPPIEWLPGDLFKIRKVLQNSDKNFQFVQDIIAEHIEGKNDGTASNYITAYLQHLESLNESGEQTTFSLHELAATTADLFIAGAETTATALLWSLPILATHPDIQNRLFEEVIKHVGTERLPTVQDKSNLAYVEAFYMEVLRYTNLVGAGLPRAVAHDTVFQGYQIPSDAMILFDMNSVLSDPKIWKDPENFRPSRFIDEASGLLRKNEEFIAFSMGKRNCVGESLARMELLLFLSTIVQKYEVVCPEGVDLSMSQIDGEFRTVHAPKPYTIVLKRRQ